MCHLHNATLENLYELANECSLCQKGKPVEKAGFAHVADLAKPVKVAEGAASMERMYATLESQVAALKNRVERVASNSERIEEGAAKGILDLNEQVNALWVHVRAPQPVDKAFDAKEWAQQWIESPSDIDGYSYRLSIHGKLAYNAGYAAATERACEIVNRSKADNHWVGGKMADEVLAELRGMKP